MDKEYKNGIRKQRASFDSMIDFVESQFNPNGHMDCDFAPDIILYMMGKLQKAAEIYKTAAEEQDEALNMEIQQWDNISKALSKADKVRESLEEEKRLRGED